MRSLQGQQLVMQESMMWPIDPSTTWSSSRHWSCDCHRERHCCQRETGSWLRCCGLPTASTFPSPDRTRKVANPCDSGWTASHRGCRKLQLVPDVEVILPMDTSESEILLIWSRVRKKGASCMSSSGTYTTDKDLDATMGDQSDSMTILRRGSRTLLLPGLMSWTETPFSLHVANPTPPCSHKRTASLNKQNVQAMLHVLRAYKTVGTILMNTGATEIALHQPCRIRQAFSDSQSLQLPVAPSHHNLPYYS